jgi:hypothetical protein
MKSLEVSWAVRPLYWPLGSKWLQLPSTVDKTMNVFYNIKLHASFTQDHYEASVRTSYGYEIKYKHTQRTTIKIQKKISFDKFNTYAQQGGKKVRFIL